MFPLIQEFACHNSPELLVGQLRGSSGVPLQTGNPTGIALLRSVSQTSADETGACAGQLPHRNTLVAAHPFLTFRAFGSRCELNYGNDGGPASASQPVQIQFGDPWQLLDRLMSRYELLDEWDLPFPLGGCFGYWGYDLKNFIEPKLSRRALQDLELPDCHLGFYDSLVAFDHRLGKTWIISTGLNPDGSRSAARAKAQFDFWRACLESKPVLQPAKADSGSEWKSECPSRVTSREFRLPQSRSPVTANLSRAEFIAMVARAQEYIRQGDIYQVNLSQRLSAPWSLGGWELYQRLGEISPAPCSAFLDCGDFEIASSSPELFLRLSGRQIQTRPIKGTRPRSADPTRDAQLAFELQTSAKEMAELVMITDLLRSDLGKVCDFGTVHATELMRLERYSHVQHLVSTVEGRLRSDATHCSAFASCFPGGSITGAPKFRAMEIIDELEPLARGPYTGALGYLGFNRESQLSIVIRTAICSRSTAYFQVGAGIVADSNPAAEYEETLAKARGFFDALELPVPGWVGQGDRTAKK